MVGYKISFFALIFIFPLTLNAQQEKENKKFTLSTAFNPVLIANDIYKLDIEARKTRSHLAHFISAELINGRTSNHSLMSSVEDMDEIKGFGMGMNQKWFFSKEMEGGLFYLSYGANYRNVSINYHGEGFHPHTENSLEYIQYGKFEEKININSVSLNTVVGLHITNNILIFDWFIGAAHKFTSTKGDFNNAANYGKHQSNFGYKGWLPQVGIKIGFKLY